MTESVAVPEGFTPHFKPSPFTAPWEPLYSRVLDDQVRIGVVLRTPHCNSRGLVHGAFLAALADNALGLSIAAVLHGRGMEVGNLLTTNLSLDYVGLARVGEWIATDATVVKAGRTLCVAQCLVASPDQTLVRASATFMNR